MLRVVLNQLSVEKRIELVFRRAATLLPVEVGNQLLVLLEPAALATMVTLLVAWAGSHFFGVGEIADIVLLIVGWAAVGGVAWEAGDNLVDFVKKTLSARVDNDLDAAAAHLSKAITLLGVQLVLALLLKKKPSDTLNVAWRGKSMPAYANAFPQGSTPALTRVTPTLTFTRAMNFRTGKTNPLNGNIRIGRGAHFGKNSREELLATIYHEKVHQFFAPKMMLFRELRIYVAQSGYRQSYILRYLEEAFAEVIAQLRANGMTRENMMTGLMFPLQNNYQITFSALGTEATGLLLGPINVGGMLYHVHHSLSQP